MRNPAIKFFIPKTNLIDIHINDNQFHSFTHTLSIRLLDIENITFSIVAV
jgi:hypothetical protein